MADTEVRNAELLKNKYGNNFFIDYLRHIGAPTTIVNGNQLYGVLYSLRTFLESDNTNRPILDDIRQISYFRNDNDRNRAITLLTNLGINYNVPQVNLIQQPTFHYLTDEQPRILTNQSEDSEKTEKVALLSNIPKDSECPICLENVDNRGYSTSKCNNFFHKECLERYCSEKGTYCACPMCRRKLNFINRNGGRKNKSRRKKQKNKNKSKRNKRRTYKFRN
jgi:hypothetical protein